MEKKKKIIIAIIILVILLSSIPYKSDRYDSTCYYALLYTVVNIHKLDIGPKGDTSTYITKGTKVYILSIKVFDNIETVIYDPSVDTI